MISLVILLKGKRGAPGEIRTWGGKRYQKTPDGWKLASSIHPQGYKKTQPKGSKKLFYTVKGPASMRPSPVEAKALKAIKEWGATKKSITAEYKASADEVGLTPREFVDQWSEDFETFLNESQNEDLENDDAKFVDLGDLRPIIDAGTKIVEGWLEGARPGRAMSDKEYEETYPDSD